MNRKTLASEIKNISHLKGTFKLRSGQTSSFYFDKYQFESHPHLLGTITDYLVPLIPKETELLGGLELGGIPLASVLSIKTNIPSVFIRKKAKEYGTQKQAEGPSIQGKSITLIEDVISTGGSVFECATALRKEGALVKNVICVIDRGSSPSTWKENNLHLKSLFNLEDFSNLN